MEPTKTKKTTLIFGLIIFLIAAYLGIGALKHYNQKVADQKFIQNLKEENEKKLEEYKKNNPNTTIKSLDDLNLGNKPVEPNPSSGNDSPAVSDIKKEETSK